MNLHGIPETEGQNSNEIVRELAVDIDVTITSAASIIECLVDQVLPSPSSNNSFSVT